VCKCVFTELCYDNQFVCPPGNELVIALEQLLSDDSFKIKTPSTIEARKSTDELMKWCLNGGNYAAVKKFTNILTDSLNKVIKAAFNKSFAYSNDKLWRQFFLLRSKADFVSRWTTFIKATGTTVKPVVFQHLTDVIFRKLLDDRLKIQYVNGTDDEDTEMRKSERGVLRYISGYICRHLRKKIERESHPFREEMVVCLMELVKSQDFEELYGTDEEWTDSIDRGGLWHVKEFTYQFFLAVEEAVRSALQKLAHPVPPSKLDMIQKITDDEDVEYYWSIVAANFEFDDREIHEVLLNKIAELYVTVRGFSYANGWLEKYKQRTKESTQKRKSLCREVHDSTTTS